MRRHLFFLLKIESLTVENREKNIFLRAQNNVWCGSYQLNYKREQVFQKFNGHPLDLKRNCSDCRPPIHVWRNQTVFVWLIPVDTRLASSCACGNVAIILLAKHSVQPWIMHFDSIFRLSLRHASPFRMDCSIAIDGCMLDFIYQQTKVAHRKWSNTVGLS